METKGCSVAVFYRYVISVFASNTYRYFFDDLHGMFTYFGGRFT